MTEEERGTVRGDAVRAHAYSLLAALLAGPPGGDLIARLRAIDAASSGAEGDLVAAWEALRLAAEHADPDDLDDEYHDLFIGVGRGELVPYGSWYTTGFMMDQPLVVLRRDLAALGFERQAGVKEPEDHAAALLETMGLLVAEGELAATQRRFFERHLGPWMPTFFLDLQKAQAARFYRAVGRLGSAFVDFERRYLTLVG